MSHSTRVVILALVLGPSCALVSQGQSQRSGETPAFASDPDAVNAPAPPIAIFESGPMDLETIRKRLAAPDAVILQGAEYDRLRKAAVAGVAGPATRPSFTIESFELRGRVDDDLAQLTAVLKVAVEADTEVWAPVHCDGQTVTGAQDDRAGPCALRASEPGGWDVLVRGRGQHEVAIDLVVPVRSDSEGHRLELAIPAVASTRLDLSVKGRVQDAELGPGQPVAVLPAPQSQGSRLSGSISARQRLSLRWRTVRDTEDRGTPLLSAQGEIAVEINRGVFEARSTWSVRCERGVARQIEMGLSDSSDEVVSLEVDEKPMPLPEGPRLPKPQLSVNLPDPLRPGSSCRLSLIVRRALSAGVTTRFGFRGFPITSATSQSGVIAIVQGPDLWVSGTAGRGSRQIDPRDLTDSLRSRPSTVLAYSFMEQPFELELRVDPSPPMASVTAQTSVHIEPGSAGMDTDLTYHVERGQFQEVRFVVPEGSELIDVGPAGLVSSHQVLQETGPGEQTRRVAVIRLDRRETADGEFVLHVTTRQRIASEGGELVLRLPRPLGVTQRGGRVQVDSVPEVAVERSGGPGERAFHTLETGAQSTPSSTPRSEARVLFVLGYDAYPEDLVLRLSPRTRSLRHESRVRVRIEHDGVDLWQTAKCQVGNGTVSALEVIVPLAWEGSWDLDEGPNRPGTVRIVSRDRLPGVTADAVRYRITFDHEVVDTIPLAFHVRIVPPEWGRPGKSARLSLPWIRLPESVAGPVRLELSTGPAVSAQTIGEGWTDLGSVPVTAIVRDGPAGVPSWAWTGPDAPAKPPAVDVTAADWAELPGTVVSRLCLRSVEHADGGLLISAWVRLETHSEALGFSLPPGATLSAVRIGNTEIVPNRSPHENEYRVPLPRSTLPTSLLVAIDYVLPRTSLGAGWAAPHFLGDVVVRQTLWEVRLPWGRDLIGCPRGWDDANEWYWDKYVWKRRPLLGPLELVAWANRCSPAAVPAVDRLEISSGYDHGYLFSRPGEAVPLRVTIWPRWALVGGSSGTLLAIGMLVLLERRGSRTRWFLGLAFALVLGVAIVPDIGIPLCESGAVGLILTIVAAVTQRFVESRQSKGPGAGEPSGVRVTTPSGSMPSVSRIAASDVASLESTVIRRQPAVGSEEDREELPAETADRPIDEATIGISPSP